MPNIIRADKIYDPSEVLTLLAVNVDFDEEDLDQNNLIIIEEKNSSQNDKDKFAEGEFLENKILV